MEKSGEAMKKTQSEQQTAKAIEKMRAYKESMMLAEEELEELKKKNKKLKEDQKIFAAEFYYEQLEMEKLQQEVEQRKRLERKQEKEYMALTSVTYQEKLVQKREQIVIERQEIQILLGEVLKDITEEKQKVERFKEIEQVIEKEKKHQATPQDLMDKIKREIQHRMEEMNLQKKVFETLQQERIKKEDELCSQEEEKADKHKIKRELREIIRGENRMQDKIEDSENELKPLTSFLTKLMTRGTEAESEGFSYDEILAFKKLQEEKLQRLMQEKTELIMRDVRLQEEQKLCEQQMDPAYVEQKLEDLVENRLKRREMEAVLVKGGALQKEQKELNQKGKAAANKYRDFHSIKGIAEIIKERLLLFQQQEEENRRQAQLQEMKDAPAYSKILDELKDIAKTGFLEKDKLIRRVSDLKETADFYLKEKHNETKGLPKDERDFRMAFAGQISQFCEETISELKDPVYDREADMDNPVKEIKIPVKELELSKKELEEKQLDALVMNAPLAPMR